MSNPWVQRKFGDLGKVTMNRRIFKEQTAETGEIPFFKIGTFGGEPDAYISRELFEDYKTKYPYPKEGNILISASGSIGRTVEYKGEEAYFQDSNIVWFEHDERILDIFLKQFYEVVKWEGLEGSTIKRLYNDNLLKTDIVLPSIQEQQQIGAFFQKLDGSIALQQRKLDLLKEKKKGYLQKMFPKSGQLYPDYRFAGFTDPWEQKKFEDVFDALSYGLNAAAIEYDGENQYLRITDIDDFTHEFNKANLKSPEIDLDTADEYLLMDGDILFARTGASTGKTYRYRFKDGKTYYAGFLIKGHPKDEFDSDFIFQNTLTDRYKSFIRTTSQRSGQPGINSKEYGSFTLLIPELSEQQQIGSFFQRIDETITLQQRKLDLLKEKKKGYLQKMFPATGENEPKWRFKEFA